MTKAAHYRLYLIAKLPSLKLLDFARVRDSERDAAKAQFGGDAGAARLAAAAEEAAAAARGAHAGADGPLSVKAPNGGPSAAQMLALKAAIAGAATLEEVSRLERALAGGQPFDAPADMQT